MQGLHESLHGQDEGQIEALSLSGVASLHSAHPRLWGTVGSQKDPTLLSKEASVDSLETSQGKGSSVKKEEGRSSRQSLKGSGPTGNVWASMEGQEEISLCQSRAGGPTPVLKDQIGDIMENLGGTRFCG